MTDLSRLSPRQRRAVEALVKLGSPAESVQMGSDYVLVSKPFHADRTPSVEVFRDGGYRDYSGSREWLDLGLKYYGTYLDLERAAEGQWELMWDELSPLTDEHAAYLTKRRITFHGGLKSDGAAICFPLWKDGTICGIQRRFTDGRTPKCRLFEGSDASGLFMPRLVASPKKVYVCEGATDTWALASWAASDSLVVGLLSASTTNAIDPITRKYGDIILCMDNDAAGREAERKIVAAYPDVQFWRFNLLVYKDINDLIMANDEWSTTKIERNVSLEFLDGAKEQAPDGLWLGWWPPEVPQGKECAFTAKDGWQWYIFPPDYDRVKARELCWSNQVSGYMVRA